MRSDAVSPSAYVDALPDDRREMVAALRDCINAHKPDGVEEVMQYGMLGWAVPHDVYPWGYHCDTDQPVPYVHVANQKGNVSLYLFCLYVNHELVDWFAEQVEAGGRKLNMGKSCVRFKRMEGIPFDTLAEVLRRMPLEDFLARYEEQMPKTARKKLDRRKAAAN